MSAALSPELTRELHPCVFAVQQLSTPFCTRPPSTNLRGLSAANIDDAQISFCLLCFFLSRSAQSRRGGLRPQRSGPRWSGSEYRGSVSSACPLRQGPAVAIVKNSRRALKMANENARGLHGTYDDESSFSRETLAF
jgi:hypothetical protein